MSKTKTTGNNYRILHQHWHCPQTRLSKFGAVCTPMVSFLHDAVKLQQTELQTWYIIMTSITFKILSESTGLPSECQLQYYRPHVNCEPSSKISSWNHNSISAVFVLCYLVDSELSNHSIFLLELFGPVAFEVDGIDEYQLGRLIQNTLGQQILDFIWWTVMSKTTIINGL